MGLFTLDSTMTPLDDDRGWALNEDGTYRDADEMSFNYSATEDHAPLHNDHTDVPEERPGKNTASKNTSKLTSRGGSGRPAPEVGGRRLRPRNLPNSAGVLIDHVPTGKKRKAANEGEAAKKKRSDTRRKRIESDEEESEDDDSPDESEASDLEDEREEFLAKRRATEDREKVCLLHLVLSSTLSMFSITCAPVTSAPTTYVAFSRKHDSKLRVCRRKATSVTFACTSAQALILYHS
jgi:hypothetical protein